jgi:hypothetical protein
MNDGYVPIDRRSERIRTVLAEINSWTNQADLRSAVKFIDETLRRRLVSMLIHCLPHGAETAS